MNNIFHHKPKVPQPPYNLGADVSTVQNPRPRSSSNPAQGRSELPYAQNNRPPVPNVPQQYRAAATTVVQTPSSSSVVQTVVTPPTPDQYMNPHQQTYHSLTTAPLRTMNAEQRMAYIRSVDARNAAIAAGQVGPHPMQWAGDPAQPARATPQGDVGLRRQGTQSMRQLQLPARVAMDRMSLEQSTPEPTPSSANFPARDSSNIMPATPPEDDAELAKYLAHLQTLEGDIPQDASQSNSPNPEPAATPEPTFPASPEPEPEHEDMEPEPEAQPDMQPTQSSASAPSITPIPGLTYAETASHLAGLHRVPATAVYDTSGNELPQPAVEVTPSTSSTPRIYTSGTNAVVEVYSRGEVVARVSFPYFAPAAQ